MITLSRFQVVEPLYESRNSRVFRGRRKEDDHPVVLKVLREQYPTPERIASFKREHQVTRSLNPGESPEQALTGVVESYSLERDHDRWVMALEDFGAESLARMGLAGGLKLDLFLEIAVQAADTLGSIHARNIIHKDINPSNLVFNRETRQLKVIDFGISTRLPRERTILRNPRVLEGTLAYMSPEQTGRTNRAMDYRSDFYSLGMTFYELLTGQLPFQSDDPLQLVHDHIAKLPRPPTELRPELPRTISDLVLRLVAKNAEDRYQSASSLKADLEECRRRWQTTGAIEPFPLGGADVSDRFQLPHKLYGREAETARLMAAFERVSVGAAELMLVAGYSGIGKSALVREVYRPITERRGYFISGKFDQLQRDRPYTALIQAFRSLARQLLTEREDAVNRWRGRLLEALWANAGVIIEVIPEFELILGPQPPVPELGPTEAQNRFNLVFQSFIGVFAAAAHPLVIFLDDLQWADPASLSAIETTMARSSDRHLFLIGAFRDNEVDEAHPLTLSLTRIREAGATMRRIDLTPLAPESVAQFVSDTVGKDLTTTAPLADLTAQMTGGNPFFLGEFLESLHARGLLELDRHGGGWCWDLDRIRSQGIPDNVVDLMTGRIQRLPEETQQVLRLAACVGNRFDLETLAVVSARPPRRVAAELWSAVSVGLVLPLSDSYKLMELDVEGLGAVQVEYRFAHDRVQQAVYSLIPDSERETVHLQIGQLLLESTPAEEQEERVFDIVDQLNHGAAQVEHDRKIELARLNLLAGRKAKASAAFPASLGYLRQGLELLDPKAWDTHYPLTLELHVEAAEAAHLCREDEELERLGELVLERGQTLVDRIRVYELRVFAYNQRNEYDRTLETALHALRLLGTELRDDLTPEQVAAGFAEAQQTLEQVSPDAVASQPRMQDPEKLAIVRILVAMTSTAFNSRPQLIPDMAITVVRLAHEHGYCPELAYGFCLFGMLACGTPATIPAGYHAGQLAQAIQEQLGSKELRTKTFCMVNAFIRHWNEPILACIEPFQEGLRSGLENGDVEYAGYCAKESCAFWLFGGELLETVETRQSEVIAVLERMAIEYTLQNANVWKQLTLNLRGKSRDRTRLVGEAFDEDAQKEFFSESKHATSLFALYVSKAILHFLYGEYDQAFQNVGPANEHAAGGFGLMHSGAWHFWEALIRLALCDPESPAPEHIEVVDAKLALLDELARHAPANYAHKHHLLAAERARVGREGGRAIVLYEQAIDLARESGFIHEEALAFELASRFYAGNGRPRLARSHLRDAHYTYRRWGALPKVRDLEAKHSDLAEGAAGVVPSRPSTTTTSRDTSALLDFASVAKASQAISSEVVWVDLLRRMMEIVVENAAAERGALVLLGEDGPRVHVLVGAETRVVPATPLTEASELSAGVVEYVLRTRQTVLLGDAARGGDFVHDPYVQRSQPRSILCAPIVGGGASKGAIYLENNLAADAFSPDRLRVIQLLSAQAAISLENANLFSDLQRARESLEEKVLMRTRELKAKNTELEATLVRVREMQDQIITQKKLASLSDLTAGIAHELKNPLNFIINFADMAGSSTRDLEQELSAAPTNEEVNRLLDQLRQNVSKISEHGQRADQIIGMMVKHSQAHASTSSPTCLSTLLEDCVKLTGTDEAVGLERDYTPDLVAVVIPQPLNSALINLLDNARWATLERRAREGDGFRPVLRVSSRDLGDSCELRIRDNGIGIPISIRERIYDPFFTTKPTGKGAGLGLSLAHEIVTKLHQGRLSIDSEEGRFTEVRIEIPKKPEVSAS